MSTSSQQLSAEIDRLFEQYLSLLDQYDSLRKRLSALQSSTLQSLARANFEAPRGTRYGEDLYDARMQATRLCRVTEDPETATTHFTIATASANTERADSVDSEGTPKSDIEDENKSVGADREKATEVQSAKAKDPIRMFGILNIPTSLRTAQSEAVKLVEVIPQLVTVDAQMKEVEIQIRRARKHRVKAESAEKAQSTTEAGREAVTAT